MRITSRNGFDDLREGDRAIFWQPADVSGAAAERLTKADLGTAHVPESWSRQDDWFSFSAVEGNAATLWIFSLRDRKAVPFGNVRSSSVLNSDVSPDGKWIAYTLRSGAVGIYVEPVPATGAKYQISKPAELAHHAMWGPDGKTLFYVAGGLPVVRVSIATQPAFSSGDPVRVPGNLPNNNDFGGPRNYHIAPDGRRFIFTTSSVGESGEAGGAAAQIRVVLNWFQELTARVPAK